MWRLAKSSFATPMRYFKKILTTKLIIKISFFFKLINIPDYQEIRVFNLNQFLKSIYLIFQALQTTLQHLKFLLWFLNISLTSTITLSETALKYLGNL